MIQRFQYWQMVEQQGTHYFWNKNENHFIFKKSTWSCLVTTTHLKTFSFQYSFFSFESCIVVKNKLAEICHVHLGSNILFIGKYYY
jgi:hypothetical protein